MAIGTILALLTGAPQLIGAVGSIYRAVTGAEPPAEALASPGGMAAAVEALPAEQRAEVEQRAMQHAEVMGAQQTERFTALLGNEAAATVEQLRSTARPEIARNAMAVIATFRWLLLWGMAALTAEWLARIGFEIWGCSTSTGPDGIAIELCKTFPPSLSVTHMLAQLEPVTAMIWPSVLAALAAATSVVRAYFGARERDKARADEMAYGKPLESTAATVANAAGALAQIVGAIRGRK